MRRFIAAILLLIFTAFNVALIYSNYNKSVNTSISITEEEETHKDAPKLIKHSKFKDYPLVQSDDVLASFYYIINQYKDVYIDIIDPPPNSVS